MLTTLGHITILVNSYDEAIEFYVKKLGFVVISDNSFGPGQRWVDVSPNKESETKIVFVLADTKEKQAAVGKQAPGHVLMTLHTNDIHADYIKMKDSGVVFHGEPQDVPWGKEVVFEDLYGNLFDLLEYNGQ